MTTKSKGGQVHEAQARMADARKSWAWRTGGRSRALTRTLVTPEKLLSTDPRMQKQYCATCSTITQGAATQRQHRSCRRCTPTFAWTLRLRTAFPRHGQYPIPCAYLTEIFSATTSGDRLFSP